MTQKISDILYEAANLLHTGHDDDQTLRLFEVQPGDKEAVEVTYICWAVCIALDMVWAEGTQVEAHPAIKFLRGLGMPGNISMRNLDWRLPREELQALRFHFCWFAAQVAEEEGL